MKHDTEIDLSVKGMRYRVSTSTRRMIAAFMKSDFLECALMREPDNRVDPNAIKVEISKEPYKGMQIGYIDKEVAATLAPLLDSKAVRVDSIVLTELDAQEATATIHVALKTPVQAKKKVIKKKSPKRA
jgi:hypothetical protein